ncbi:MAG TPA: MCP four helix bundle domain-containing protein [Fimbriimonadaceae bacterium]|nr:MCP four helix bundle domain-containing protein [Fimbriimonadaceae bacterium]
MNMMVNPRNIKISVRLALAFGICAALTAIVGFYSISRIDQLSSDLREVGQVNIEKLKVASELSTDVQKVTVPIRTLLIRDLSPEERAEQEKRFVANMDEMQKVLDSISSGSTALNTADIPGLDEALSDYKAGLRKAESMIRAKNYREATHFLLGEGLALRDAATQAVTDAKVTIEKR